MISNQSFSELLISMAIGLGALAVITLLRMALEFRMRSKMQRYLDKRNLLRNIFKDTVGGSDE